MADKKFKVFVVGLPKTGTSTLAVMLRMLGYNVTGPEIDFKIDNLHYLEACYEKCNAFQDYPWCFEWEYFLDRPEVKLIVLKRDRISWWRSFLESYGGSESRYLSYPYMKLDKTSSNKNEFLNFYDVYYENVKSKQILDSDRFIELNLQTFTWIDLCAFLDENIPRDILGREVSKPHVNKNYSQNKRSKLFILNNYIRKKAVSIFGKRAWNKFIVFLRKNQIY